MTLRVFLLGLLTGLLLGALLARSSERSLWHRLRDSIAHLIDAGMRIGLPSEKF